MTQTLGIYEAWRYFNMALAIAAASVTFVRMAEMWPRIKLPQRFRFLALEFFCFTYVFSGLALIVDNIPGGPRTVISTVPLIWMILAGLMHERR